MDKRAEHLATLGLAPTASWDEVTQAYKDLMRVWHPDRFTGNERMHSIAEEKLRDINVAYRVLQSVPPEAPPVEGEAPADPTAPAPIVPAPAAPAAPPQPAEPRGPTNLP